MFMEMGDTGIIILTVASMDSLESDYVADIEFKTKVLNDSHRHTLESRKKMKYAAKSRPRARVRLYTRLEAVGRGKCTLLQTAEKKEFFLILLRI